MVVLDNAVPSSLPPIMDYFAPVRSMRACWSCCAQRDAESACRASCPARRRVLPVHCYVRACLPACPYCTNVTSRQQHRPKTSTQERAFARFLCTSARSCSRSESRLASEHRCSRPGDEVTFGNRDEPSCTSVRSGLTGAPSRVSVGRGTPLEGTRCLCGEGGGGGNDGAGRGGGGGSGMRSGDGSRACLGGGSSGGAAALRPRGLRSSSVAAPAASETCNAADGRSRSSTPTLCESERRCAP